MLAFLVAGVRVGGVSEGVIYNRRRRLLKPEGRMDGWLACGDCYCCDFFGRILGVQDTPPPELDQHCCFYIAEQNLGFGYLGGIIDIATFSGHRTRETHGNRSLHDWKHFHSTWGVNNFGDISRLSYTFPSPLALRAPPSTPSKEKMKFVNPSYSKPWSK